MDPAKRIDSVIAQGLVPLLKAHGFAKSARTFHRQRDGRWHVVNVQASSGNSAGQARFTLNLGLYLPELDALAGNAAVTDKPKEYDCTLRERIGLLMPQARDHWWTLAPDTDADALAADLAQAMSAHGLPWFDAYATAELIAAHFADAPTVLSAAAALAAGQNEEAARRIERMLVERPRAQAVAKAWMARHLPPRPVGD
ncbi:DUF4304 domain-containing protein [Lysobacter enzymogenes]|uniref:DUF4304 domain-containing protein n=1 Tax=Lysobacter enzymogenes TaxID=69 RepID=UPI0037483FFF